MSAEPPEEFRAFSARCGSDPMRVQGAGGNTSIKMGEVMWIKASGTQLADAGTQNIFVATDHAKALAEAHGSGDGTCKAARLDPTEALWPSIETTFHAAIAQRVVAHTHSIATLVHAISPDGVQAARAKLQDLPCAIVPYRKPGLPLTEEIQAHLRPDTKVIILQNHGLIVAGDTTRDVAQLMDEVEKRLAMPILCHASDGTDSAPPEGYEWDGYAGSLGQDRRLTDLAMAGSYYPDHVVFLAPGLPPGPVETSPACIIAGAGIAVKTDATVAQRAMVRCLADVLTRLPPDWGAEAIGEDAERALLDWDAEKYRQALSVRGG